jgi:hypothetical protein
MSTPPRKPRGGFPLGGTVRAIVIAFALGELLVLALASYLSVLR